MTEPNWGLITSGATFEALATMLVHFADPAAGLFGRPGNDGGQDAISSDGKRVFQAKHHADASPAKVIKDAKKEAAKIRKHRQPRARRHAQWKGVKYWRLMTNALFNPNDKQRWKTEVLPIFKRLGLKAEYWDRRKLEADLAKFPEVQQHFFAGETRVLQTLREARETLSRQQPFLRGRFGKFFGRQVEQKRVLEFLASDRLFLAVHGAGGTGKTRFLLEAGEVVARRGGQQVLWAMPASMSHSSTWFRGIASRLPTLLLLDEPTDSRLLDVLVEQLRSPLGVAARWKVLVATRSANDSVIQTLSRPDTESWVERLSLEPLPSEAAEAMCDDLLESGKLALSETQRRRIARDLARRFSGHPIWITLAVELLEQHGHLSKIPKKVHALASQYIDEIVKQQTKTSPDQVRAVLRWIALLGTVNRDDAEVTTLIREGTGVEDRDELLGKLSRLVERKALIARGRDDRLVELKPDVLRDHVLQEWLTVDIGRDQRGPSADAKSLVERIGAAAIDGDAYDLERRILAALGRTQLLFRFADQPVPLLDGFFTTLRTAISGMPASKRVRLAELLHDVAVFDPVATISLLRLLREAPCLEEMEDGPFRMRAYSHDDVVLALARPAFGAARNARTPEEQRAAFRELCALTEVEAEILQRGPRGLPNDGNRAAHLLEKTIDGGHGFWGDYHDVAQSEALRLLDQIAQAAPDTRVSALVDALVSHAMNLDRTDEWLEEKNFVVRQYALDPAHPAWKTRASLLERVKQTLEAESTPLASREALWRIFAKGHMAANQWARLNEVASKAQGDHGLALKELEKASLRQVHDDLAWAHRVLSSRHLQIEELHAARKLWHWHIEYGPESPEKACARKLETLYARNDLAAEFDPLFDPDDGVTARRPAQKAVALARDESNSAIDDFLARGSRFLGGDAQLVRLGRVMWCLGAIAAASEKVQHFIRKSLARSDTSPRSDLAIEAAAGWVWTQRQHAPATAHEVVDQMVDACGSGAQKVRLLLRLYGGLDAPAHQGERHAAEHALLRSSGPMFLQERESPAFVGALAFTLDHDWDALKPLLESTLTDMPPDQLGDAVRRLILATQWALGNKEPFAWPADLVIWVFDQIVRLPDLGQVASQDGSHYLDGVVRKLGRLPITWLYHALTKRMQWERLDESGRVRAVSYNARVGRYVAPLRKGESVPNDTAQATESLIDLADDLGSVGHALPELLGQVDPEGVLVPAGVTARVGRATTLDDLYSFAKLAAAYVFGTPPWRLIARAAFARAAEMGIDPEPIFQAVSPQQSSWHGRHGEVPDSFRSAVERAQHALDGEQDLVFQPFWRWQIECVQADLRAAEGRAKEQRGE